MGIRRTLATALMSRGVISSGWYAILTGLALLLVAYLLSTASATDPAAPYVAVVLALTGLWQSVSGIRAELRRHRGTRAVS